MKTVTVEKEPSVRKLNEILDKLRDIENRFDKIEQQYFKKRGLRWKAAVPSLQVCKDIVSAYNGDQFHEFDYEMQRLAEFYGIRPMKNRTDPGKVPKNAIACYHSSEQTAFYKNPTTNLDTLLHEFFHHLCSESVVYLYSDENEEKCANGFADIVIARGQMP